MPAFQVMCSLANEAFAASRIHKIDPKILSAGAGLADIMDKLELVPHEAYRGYLSNWPAALQEAVRAAVFNAVSREPRMPVHFAWAPAYDYSVKIWEAHSTADSSAAMTILLESPYPGEKETSAAQ